MVSFKERFYHHFYSILFNTSIIYLNGLPLAPSSCDLESYADDLKLFLYFPLIELGAVIEKLEQDLSVAQWCCENHLPINPDKTNSSFSEPDRR